MKTWMRGLVAAAILTAVSRMACGQIYSGDFMIIEESNYVTIYSYLGSAYDVIVPPYINNKPVTVIGGYAFADCTTVRTVSLPATVVTIAEYAFANCSNLASFLVPDSVTEIKWNAFEECTSLKSLTIGGRVQTIGTAAFQYCEMLENITIPDSVTTLGREAFYKCTALKSAVIGKEVTEIGDWTFTDCGALTSVSLGSKVTRIGRWAFDGCSSLPGAILPASVTSIDTNAFADCAALRALKFFGDAPSTGDAILYGATQSTVYYLDGKAGWGPTFGGRPTAKWSGGANVLPAFTQRTPTADPSASEGASVAFGVTASDNADPETSERGMVSIAWFVNGTKVLETKTGAPNAISSTYTLKTGPSTVQGAADGQIEVKAVAADKQGGIAESVWTAKITNVPSAQTITFPTLPQAASGDADVSPGATAKSGLPVTYTSSNEAAATIVDGKIHIVGPGIAVITASQAGNSDFKAATPVRQTLTVKCRVSATKLFGNGTVTGSGLYAPGSRVTLTARPAPGYTLLRWSDWVRYPTRTIQLGTDNFSIGAVFGLTSEVKSPTFTVPGDQYISAGVAYSRVLELDSDSLATITVSGLPAGMKFDPLTSTISGVPTQPGLKIVTVTAKNANPVPTVMRITFNVAALPIWAAGDFSGWVTSASHPRGLAQFNVSPQGRISGKFLQGAKTYTFSANGFKRFQGNGALTVKGAFWVDVTATCTGMPALPLRLFVHGPDGDIPLGLGQAQITLNDADFASLFRIIWKDAGAASTLAPLVGYYTAALPCADSGSGYLAFTVDKAGSVKTAGKLADGTAVSFSGPLVMDWDGRLFTVCGSSPAAYMGGMFFGIAEFAPNTAGKTALGSYLPDMFSWTNNNPLSTEQYGGFERETDLVGGWYDKLINLRAFYENGLVVEGVNIPSGIIAIVRYTDFNPESLSENPPKISWTEKEEIFDVGVNPNGTVLAVTPATGTGTGTGLAAPKAGVPVRYSDPDAGVWYDYDVNNSAALTTTFTRATGLYRGAFKVYFDYISASDLVTARETTTHLVKSVAYEGVLTPVKPDGADDTAGLGFFLWPGQSEYENALGRTVPYTFNYSNDFQLLPALPAE